MKRIGKGWILAALIAALIGCASSTPYSVAVAEEKAVQHCSYLDTLAENSDMGAFQIHPKLTFDAQDRVLRRAEKLQATHVVWLANQAFGAAAAAYYCPNDPIITNYVK